MAHQHSVYDTDAHFKINAITRAITSDSSGKTVLIQGDHNSERFTFEVPRTVDGHDLSLCNVAQIHYINIDSANKANTSADVYEVDDLQVSPESEDVVILSWLISGNATKYPGSLNFLVKFKCVEKGEAVYVWNSAVFSSVSVSAGIDNGAAVIEEYSDALETWKAQLLGNRCDVKQLGAEGDGVADDSDIIQYALNTYRTVEFPEGTYRVKGLTVPSNTKIVGDNATLKIINETDKWKANTNENGANCLNILGTKDAPIRNIEISGIHFDGNCDHFFTDCHHHVYEKFANNGVFMQNAENITIHHCSFDNLKDRCIGAALYDYLGEKGTGNENAFGVHGLHVYDCEFLADKLPIATEWVGGDAEEGEEVTGGGFYEVVLQSGTYKETNNFVPKITANDVTAVEGATTNKNKAVYSYMDASGNTKYCREEFYTIKAGYYRVPATTPAIQLNQSGIKNCNSDIIIERCTVHKSANMGFMFYYHTKNVTIRDCTIMNCGLYTSEGINSGTKKHRVVQTCPDTATYYQMNSISQSGFFKKSTKVSETMHNTRPVFVGDVVPFTEGGEGIPLQNLSDGTVLVNVNGEVLKDTDENGNKLQAVTRTFTFVYSYENDAGETKYCWAEAGMVYRASPEIVDAEGELAEGVTNPYGDVYKYTDGDGNTCYYSNTDTWEYYDSGFQKYVQIRAIADIEDAIDYWYFYTNEIGDDDGKANHAVGGCIKFNSVQNALIENCYLYGGRGANISIYSSDASAGDLTYPPSKNITIRNNRIFGNPDQIRSDGYGVLVSDATDVSIVGNTFKDHNSVVRGHAIFGNTIARYENSAGISSKYDCCVSDNIFDACKYAVIIKGGSVTNNRIVNCNYSITAGQADKLRIIGNHIEKGDATQYANGNGIHLEQGGSDCIIASNIFDGLAQGVDIKAGEYDSVNIYGNLFPNTATTVNVSGTVTNYKLDFVAL